MSAAAAPLVKKVFGSGRRRPLELRRFDRLFERGEALLAAEPRAVLEEVRAARRRGPGVFLDTLSEAALPVLAGQGLVIHIDRGSVLTHKSSREREAFVVLEGALEVVDGERVLATAGPGHLLGEGSLFRPSGERAASIRARTDARIMVLRRRFLVDLARVAPDVAVDVMLAMGHELSERVGASSVAPSPA